MLVKSAVRRLPLLLTASAFCSFLAIFVLSSHRNIENRKNLETALLVSPAKTTKLNDYTVYDQKVVWDPLRPEHPEYYPRKMYLYSGQESSLYGHGQRIGDVKSVLRKGHSQTVVKMLPSLRVHEVRAATWDETAHAIVFPPFKEYPDLHMISKTDLKGYASQGNNIVFMGGFGSLAIINEIFGWQLSAVPYQAGPFYKSERNAHNTVFEGTPSTVTEGASAPGGGGMVTGGTDWAATGETPWTMTEGTPWTMTGETPWTVTGGFGRGGRGGGGSIYGTRMGSMPTGARSYYDSLGDSVVWAVRYDLGMVTYVGCDMQEFYNNAQWHRLLQAAVAL